VVGRLLPEVEPPLLAVVEHDAVPCEVRRRLVVIVVVDGAFVPCGLLVLAEVHAQALPQQVEPG